MVYAAAAGNLEKTKVPRGMIKVRHLRTRYRKATSLNSGEPRVAARKGKGLAMQQRNNTTSTACGKETLKNLAFRVDGGG